MPTKYKLNYGKISHAPITRQVTDTAPTIIWVTQVARRRGRRGKKLLDDLKDRRGYSHLKEEALHRTIWRHSFGGGFGPVVRQNTE